LGHAELNQAITNIIEGDTSNSVAIHNPARTGALRVTANQRWTEPPPVTAKHYHAKTVYTRNYTYICLYLLSIVASLVYIALRMYYIATGEKALKIPVNNIVDDPRDPTGRTPIRVDALLRRNQQDGSIGAELDMDDINNNPDLAPIKQLVDDYTYSYWWSCVVLAAEIGGFVLVHLSQQMFIRQDTKFFEMAPERIQQLRDVRSRACACVRAAMQEPAARGRLCLR
jgi:hypothetical protein